MIRSEEALYQSCYCEENVYKLIETVGSPQDLYAVLISNDELSTPLWRQKYADGDDDEFVLWDYHVIAIQKGDESKVYDLDSTLDWGCTFETYWKDAIRVDHPISKIFSKQFRVMSGATYLSLLSSDRRHMQREDGSFTKPPPEWPLINPQSASNLMQLIEMSEVFDGTIVLDETQMFAFFA